MMIDKDFDFGFSFDENLSAKVNTKDVELQLVRAALADICNLIGPLLTNLKREPDKPTIYWPNRVERIEAFEDQIEKIVKEVMAR